MTPDALAQTLAEAFACHQAGELATAERKYRRCLADDPENLNALQLLGALRKQTGAVSEAVVLLCRAVDILERSSTVAPQHAALYHNLGQAFSAVGESEEAQSHYRRGLKLDPQMAELHFSLGDELSKTGEFESAVASYESGRQHGRASLVRLCRLGTAYAIMNRPSNAQAAYRDAVATVAAPLMVERMRCADGEGEALHNGSGNAAATSPTIAPYSAVIAAIPANADVYCLVARALREASDANAAIEVLRLALKINPNHVASLYELGTLLVALGIAGLAVPLFEAAVRLNPESANFHAALGNALYLVDDSERARKHHRHSLQLQPVRTLSSKEGHSAFSLLVIEAPGVGNTPCQFLLSDLDFDCHFISIMTDIPPDIAFLRGCGDVILNLISDVDQGRHILPRAADTIDQIGKPAINHPRRILNTDRDTVSAALAGIASCRTPRTIRCNHTDLEGPDATEMLARNGLVFPFLLRVPGSHGGDAFDKIDRAEAIRDFMSVNPASDYYATEFVDYRSSDGFHRKYRFIAVAGELYPYHLAIGNTWKVHHYNTDMAYYQWMRDEEEAFLDDPWKVFTAMHQRALRQICIALDLEFFGIDCALDSNLNLSIFEANASMLVHNDNAGFEYKTPHCARIKAAFQAMVAEARHKAASEGNSKPFARCTGHVPGTTGPAMATNITSA